MRNGEAERSGQLAADPVQGVEPRAAAVVLALHLPDHYFRIRVDVEGTRFQCDSALQSLKQGYVFSDIIVLAADPASYLDDSAVAAVDHDSNTRRSRIPQRTAVHISYQIQVHPLSSNMRQECSRRQELYLVPMQHWS